MGDFKFLRLDGRPCRVSWYGRAMGYIVCRQNSSQLHRDHGLGVAVGGLLIKEVRSLIFLVVGFSLSWPCAVVACGRVIPP